MAAQPVPPVTIRNLTDLRNTLEARGIIQAAQHGEAEFLLHEETSLDAASKLSMIARAGRNGFRLRNPELLTCKSKAKHELDEAFRNMHRQCVQECDRELIPLDTNINFLKGLLILEDFEIALNGPDITERNQGPHYVLCPTPLYPADPGAEFYVDQAQWVPYQVPYGTQEEMEEARPRDHRAQRAWWRTNLKILEAKRKVL